MQAILKYILALLIVLTPMNVYAEQIPPHMAAMAAQLYKGVEDDLKGKQLTPERRMVLDESIRTLRKMGVHHWSTRPVKISGVSSEVGEILKLDLTKRQDRNMLGEFMSIREDKGTEAALRAFEKEVDHPVSQDERNSQAAEIDAAISAAQEDLEKTYVSTPENGRAVQMKWKPDAGRFFMKVFDDGSGNSEEFATTFAGDVHAEISENGQDMMLGVEPSDNPLRAMSEEDMQSLRGNILGEWKDEGTGEVYVFSAAETKTGEITPTREALDEQIERLAGRLETINNSRIFEWKNLETGEVVKQEKFRRLKEPYKFIGEKYALDNAEEEIARLKRKVEELEIERDGSNLLPVERHDPAGFGDLSISNKARSITVTVTHPDGYSYNYDEAVFDGRRISAKRTYRDIRDITNLRLPEVIRRQAIDDGWNPPGWLELDATIDVETGDSALEGDKWALQVTYDSYFGQPGDIKRIHSPWPSPRHMRKEGMVFDVAEGAAADFIP